MHMDEGDEQDYTMMNDEDYDTHVCVNSDEAFVRSIYLYVFFLSEFRYGIWV
jgi:hypothetical protein